MGALRTFPVWVALAACGERGTDPARLPRCDPYADPGCGLPPRAAERRCLADGAFPDHLSETGCFDGTAPGPDLVPYDVVSALWSDGAAKGRWIVLDPGDTVGFAAEGPWDWPLGTTFVKHFSLPTGGALVPVETRFLRLDEAGWTSASYAWEGEDAVRLDALEQREVAGVAWTFPAGDGCGRCHATGAPLGPETPQLHRDVAYGDAVAPQLDALDAIGLLDGYAGGELPALTDPTDPAAPLAARARAYLDANCSHCHQPGGWTPPGMTLDLRAELPLAETHLCDEAQYWNGASSGRRRIDPGHPERSELWLRMIDAEGTGPMPPYGAVVPDVDAIELVRQWIAALDACP